MVKELNEALGKTLLDPYEYRWLETGAAIFIKKLESSGVKSFADADPKSFATALSRYNGGAQLEYPNSDQGTTGGDYGNDTMVRARWFAQNWENL